MKIVDSKLIDGRMRASTEWFHLMFVAVLYFIVSLLTEKSITNLMANAWCLIHFVSKQKQQIVNTSTEHLRLVQRWFVIIYTLFVLSNIFRVACVDNYITLNCLTLRIVYSKMELIATSANDRIALAKNTQKSQYTALEAKYNVRMNKSIREWLYASLNKQLRRG